MKKENNFEKIYKFLIDFFGDDFEDGELDLLILKIMALYDTDLKKQLDEDFED